ncbi:MAG: ABC transporter permease [Gemmatimonadota bacterium]
MLNNLRIATRSLIRTPGFTAAAVLTLALGIGANTAIFSLLNTVVLRPLPYQDPARLVVIEGSDGERPMTLSERERVRIREQSDIFEQVATVNAGWSNLTGQGEAERLRSATIDPELMALLGIVPILGHGFTSDDAHPGGGRVAVISNGLWRRRFGEDSAVIGRRMILDGEDVTIVGVAAPDFRLPGDYLSTRSEVFLPSVFTEPDPRNLHYLDGYARLRTGVTPEQAAAHMHAVAVELRNEIAALPTRFDFSVTPVEAALFGRLRPALYVLLGAVGLVLLIACANVVSLLIARSESRQREFAVRAALGAGRGQVASQLLAESLILAVAGGLLALLFASWCLHALIALSPPDLPRIDEISLDGRVLGFTAAVSLITSIVFGGIPALRLRLNPASVLRAGGRGTTSARLGRGLVVAEVAFGLLLAIGAGLVMKSFLRLTARGAGFDTRNALAVELTLPSSTYGDVERARLFYYSLLETVRDLPEVETAGAVTNLPLLSVPGDWGVRIEGREEELLPNGRKPWGDWHVASSGYFEAMKIPLIAGRTFTDEDRARGNEVVVINQAMARAYWPGRSPVGERFRMSSTMDTVYRTIVGVVADVRQGGLDSDALPELFLPQSQFPNGDGGPVRSMALVIRTTGDPSRAIPALRRAVSEADPTVPIARVETMDQVLAQSTSVRRLHLLVFGVFAAVSLVLIAVGAYGVMSYQVQQRTRELGIRMALGAQRADVLRMVLGEGMGPAAVGILVGLLAALLMTRLITSIVYGVSVTDVGVFLLAPLVLAVVALVANTGPAIRAVRADPGIALRSE